MEKVSKKSIVATMVVSVLCLVIVVFASTYAYFTPFISGEGELINVISGKIKLSISENKITASNLAPIKDSTKDTRAQKNEFTISRTDDSNLDACYSLYLIIDNIGDSLKNKWFKYELDYVDVNGNDATLSGNFSSITPEEDGTLKIAFLTNQEIGDSKTSRTYTLRLWLSYSETEDQTSILTGDAESRTFNAHVLASGQNGKCTVQSS